MSANLFYAAAISLPRSNSYLCLHWHQNKSRCLWTEADTDIYNEVLKAARGGAVFGVRTQDISFGEEPRDQLKLLPYYLTISYSRSQKPNFKVVTKVQHNIQEVESVGPDRIRVILLNKTRERLVFDQKVLESVSAKMGEPFTQEHADTIEGRSNPLLIKEISSNYEPSKGLDLKLVAVPPGIKIRLSRNSQGEYIREIARTWS